MAGTAVCILRNGEPLKDFIQNRDTCFQKMLEGARMDVSRDEQMSWHDCWLFWGHTADPLRQKSLAANGEFPIPGSIQVQ